jgi:4-diphosphocytidyl-2-C-methyl-D-erythritol kinase
MTALFEAAKAKLNLTLKVVGRRPDGFHEIESLVAFTELGDGLELEPQDELGLTIDGPFASALAGPNLVEAAAETVTTLGPSFRLGHFTLHKHLPVAAGLGGGSADAAASLRLLVRANPDMIGPRALREVASRLGSDVPVCLESRPSLMTGRGEVVSRVKGMPSCGVLLANPRTPLATERVFASLQSEELGPQRARPAAPEFGGSFDALVDYASERANDLERTALSLEPVIGEVLGALSRLDGARLVRLSGSGPTCFALFASQHEAKRASAALEAARPDWWVTATILEGSDEAASR